MWSLKSRFHEVLLTRSNDVSMVVHPVERGDLEEVFDLYRRTVRFPPSDRLERYWNWKFISNPCRRPELTPFWIARRAGMLVGGVAQLHVLLDVAGESVAAAWAVDFMVDPRFQRQRIGTTVFSHFRRSNDVAIVTGHAPNSATSRVARAAGFPQPSRLAYMFKLLTTRPLTNRLRVGGIIGRAIGRLSRVPLRRLGHVHRDCAAGLRFEEITRFTDSFDALWRAVASEANVVVRRDHATMNWRYLDNPFHRYRVLGAWAGHDLVGCLVLKIVRQETLTYGTIPEIVAPAQAVDVQEGLLASALEEFEREDVDIVKSLAQPAHLTRLLRRAGFLALGPGCDFVISVAPHLRSELPRLDGADWYVTKGDCDLDMIPDFMTHIPVRAS